MAAALRSLGVGIVDNGDDWIVTPGRLHEAEIDTGLAGTVMRFVPPLAALADGPVTFDGDLYARERPMASLLDGLRQLGVEIDDGGRGRMPFTVHGRGAVPGGTVRIDASASSQFVSGLLLAGARYDKGIEIIHTGAGPVPSLPHIDMTLDLLRAGRGRRALRRAGCMARRPAFGRRLRPDRRTRSVECGALPRRRARHRRPGDRRALAEQHDSARRRTSRPAHRHGRRRPTRRTRSHRAGHRTHRAAGYRPARPLASSPRCSPHSRPWPRGHRGCTASATCAATRPTDSLRCRLSCPASAATSSRTPTG